MNGSGATSCYARGWFTSSFSNEGNGCVQVRHEGNVVFVGDSKQRAAGPVIRLSGPDWDAFILVALGAVPDSEATALPITRGPHDSHILTATDGTSLRFTAHEWSTFTAGAAVEEFRSPARVRTA